MADPPQSFCFLSLKQGIIFIFIWDLFFLLFDLLLTTICIANLFFSRDYQSYGQAIHAVLTYLFVSIGRIIIFAVLAKKKWE